MNASKALQIVYEASTKQDGAWVTLRLGQDPGANRTRELRTALRQSWRALKETEGIPHGIGYAAAAILHFQGEARRNLERDAVGRRELLERELPDIVQCAFDLLSGPDAEAWVIDRPDLGD